MTHRALVLAAGLVLAAALPLPALQAQPARGAGTPAAAPVIERATDLSLEGKDAEAERLLRAELAKFEARLGAAHRETKLLANQLRLTLERQDKHADVRTMLLRELAALERAVPPVPAEIADVHMALARNAATLGDTAGQRTAMERAIAAREGATDADPEVLSGAHRELAQLFAIRRDTAAARRHHERALAIRERAFGADHRSVAESLEDLAELIAPSTDDGTARRLFERALAIREAGDWRWATIDVLEELGFYFRARGERAEAQRVLARRLALQDEEYAEKDSSSRELEVGDLLEALDQLAEAHLAANDPAAARPILERAITLRERYRNSDLVSGLQRSLLVHAAAAELLGDTAAAAASVERARSLLDPGEELGREAGIVAQLLRTAGADSAARALTTRGRAAALRTGATRDERSETDLAPGLLLPRPDEIRETKVFRGTFRDPGQRMAADTVRRTFELVLTAGSHVEIEMETEEYGPSLQLLAPGGVPVGEQAGPLLRAAIDRSGRWAAAIVHDTSDSEPFTLTVRLLTPEGFARAERRAIARDRAYELGRELYAFESEGRHEEALRVAERLLRIREATEGPGDPLIADALGSVAAARATRGDYTGARALYERALAILREAYGVDALGTGMMMTRLADVLFTIGDHAAARPLYEQALRIDENVHGRDDTAVNQALSNLAWNELALGNPDSGRTLLARAVTNAERGGASRRTDLGVALSGLGAFLMAQREHAAAVPVFQRALAIAEEVYPAFRPGAAIQDLNADAVGVAHANLAQALAGAGRVRDAVSHYTRALRIIEGTLGSDHPTVAAVLASQGVLHLGNGGAATAIPLLRRSVQVSERSYGASHPVVADRLQPLAEALQATGAVTEARALMERAARIIDEHARTTLPSLAPAEQRAFVSGSIAATTARLLSGVGGLPVATAYRYVAGWKGLLLQGLRRQVAIARLGGQPEHASSVAELQAIRGAIAANFARAGDLPADSLRAIGDSLSSRKERLERALSAALPADASGDAWQAVGGTLRTALSPGSALVDVYRHEIAGATRDSGFRYSAVISVAGGEPRLVELGNAATIDSLVARWVDAVTRGDAAAPETAALRAAVWSPIARGLGGSAARVWVSPDAQLARIPWNTIAAIDDRSTRGVAEIASPRALAQQLAATRGAGTGGALLVGDVDFGAPRAAAAWAPLPGTRVEIDSLSGIAQRAAITHVSLTDSAATPRAVTAALPRVAFAHLATHGFFHRESRAAYGTRGLGIVPAVAGDAPVSRNPLAESGLGLAGANEGPAGNLTAEELLGIDLSNLRLIVLSACETGRGTEITGQGVMGLRASLEAAGAHAIVMSLWKVPDASTALFMTAFYDGLWGRRMAPADALAHARATVQADPRFRAPIHWAAWVLAGDAWQPAS